MFFQLDQVSRLTKTTEELEKAKERLSTLVIDAYRPDNRVKQSLAETIQSILKMSNEKLGVIQRVEEDALNGYLIPSFLDFQTLTSDRGELPQWTRIVFEKQFEKQKKSLDVMAKKIYAAHSLTEAKDKLIRQINSFKILSDRYKALSEHDEMIDIMAEAEKLRNLTKLTNQKFLGFCNSIVLRLTAFTGEMTSKCCNFSAELNQFVDNSKNAWIHPQETRNPPQFQQKQGYGTQGTQGGWMARANRTVDRPMYRSTQSNNGFVQRQPKWLQSSYTSDFYN